MTKRQVQQFKGLIKKKKPLSVLYIFFTLSLTSVLFLFSVLDGGEGSSASMSATPPHTSVVSVIGRRRNSSSLHNVLVAVNLF